MAKLSVTLHIIGVFTRRFATMCRACALVQTKSRQIIISVHFTVQDITVNYCIET